MAAVSSTSKKPRNKNPKGRAPATSDLSQPTVDNSWTSSIFSSFSPKADYFAFLSLALDKHRLRVFDVSSNKAIAEHVFDKIRVSSLTWIHLDTNDTDEDPTRMDSSPSKKRKKATGATDSENQKPGDVGIAVGTENGSIQIFSVLQNRVAKTLSHPSSSSPILSLATNPDEGSSRLWTSGKDGSIRVWDLNSGELVFTATNDGKGAVSALAVEPTTKEKDSIQILSGSHTIKLSSSSRSELKDLFTFTGHASSVTSLLWDVSSITPTRFYSCAEDDRFIYIWETPSSTSGKGKMVASCSLDSSVREIGVAYTSGRSILLALSSSGKVAIAPVPSELVSTSTKSKQQIPTLLPRSTISLQPKRASDGRIISACLVDNNVRLAMLSGGTRLAFESVMFLDDSGEFVPEVKVQMKTSTFDLIKDPVAIGATTQRYAEPAGLAVAAGTAIGDVNLDQNVTNEEADGALDVELAELSLGQRLAAREGRDGIHRLSGSDQEGETGQHVTEGKRKKKKKTALVVPANSLSRTLIQALHSSDVGLLESCLAHSDESLVRNTVQRLPQQLAIPLLTACVERLGRGSRGNNMKGRGGGASAQRGTALVVWVKAVLIIHSGHLMTLPDLVARLSSLHTTLSSRLVLQERLLSLSGRLDLVLSQVELRSSTAPAPAALPSKKRKKNKKSKQEPSYYVEGESSDEEDLDPDAEVEIEEEDDEGSVEDIDLGRDSSEEESDEQESGAEEEDEDDDEEGNMMNGFIDDEAEEEDYEEDESEDSDED